jgi:flagellar motor switch protein FliG
MTQLPTAIRKAAILVSTLDDQAADALLAQMGDEMAARVRNAMMELADIDTGEQQAVLAEFLRGGNKSNSAADAASLSGSGGVEFDESLLARIDEPSRSTPSAASPASRQGSNPFDFLADAPPRSVAEILAREQPQTIAVVVSRLSPDLAAQLLESLPPALATDALERMAWLDEPAAEVLADLAHQLRCALAPYLRVGAERSQALAGLHAVLGAMDHSSRTRVLSGLAARNRSLSRQLGHPHSAAARTPVESEPEVISYRYRLARPDECQRHMTLVDFDDFTTFSDETIRRILAAAEPQMVLLALTGADESLLARILRQLPPRAAATLRTRLNHPGAVRLRDIEAAREQLADLARRLAEQGVVVLPGSRHFAAAA